MFAHFAFVLVGQYIYMILILIYLKVDKWLEIKFNILMVFGWADNSKKSSDLHEYQIA